MLTFVLTPQAWLGAGLIFLLRVTDMTLDTMRVMMVMRGKRGFVWILGFFQATVFVVAITSVLSNLDNPLNILAYAAGFATGNVVGMWIEERLAIGHTHMSIVSPTLGAAIAEQMRLAGYAITEIPARGKDGMVTLLSCSVLRKNVEKVHQIVNTIDPTAFITAEDVRPVRRGFWRAQRVLVVILPALTIFALRIVDITMYTMRLMMLVRGRKAFTWVFAFLQSFIYVTALRAVLADLGAPLKVLGYAAGFATGMVVGMWLESRVAIGYSQLRIISLGRGAEIAEHLRSAGYSITEVAAHGRDGTVTVLNLNVPRRQSNQAAQIAAQTDPQAFVTAKSVRLIQRGTSQT